PRCTPLLSSNRCYSLGAEGRLLCLDLPTGRLIWECKTAERWKVPPAFFGVGSTPVLEGGRLFVMVGGQPNSGVVAFAAETGEVLWESVGKSTWDGVVTRGWRVEKPYTWTGEEKSASYSTPVLATFHGRRHLLCVMRQGLVSLDPTNGEVNFKRWFQSYAHDSVNAMNPVVQGDLILMSAAYYRSGVFVLRVGPDGRSYEELWRDPRRHPLDAEDRDPVSGRWKAPVLEIHWTTPILHEGHVYAFSGRNEPDATFRCVELATGRLKWERSERWAPHSSKQPNVYGRGSAILAEGRLIVLGEGGLLGLFEANPRQAVERSRFQVPDLHYPCWAAPILSEKRLYLRSEDRLICFNLARGG
ncbi:MAG TPA: PQQ-binding-like beta-propeller repeat protein, partial [Methylomirabilota bacterium]|nr:PQQ-binding-like beta-propeller repeat protein [Methylomirabilota bacterium]